MSYDIGLGNWFGWAFLAPATSYLGSFDDGIWQPVSYIVKGDRVVVLRVTSTGVATTGPDVAHVPSNICCGPPVVQ